MKQLMPLPLFLSKIEAGEATVGFSYDITRKNVTECQSRFVAEIEMVLEHFDMKKEALKAFDFSDIHSLIKLAVWTDDEIDQALIRAGNVALRWCYDKEHRRENYPNRLSLQITAWPLNDEDKIDFSSNHIFKISFFKAKK